MPNEHIIIIHTGQAALEIIELELKKQQEGQTNGVKLLILDYNLPEINGLDLIKRAHELY